MRKNGCEREQRKVCQRDLKKVMSKGCEVRDVKGMRKKECKSDLKKGMTKGCEGFLL